MSDDLVKQSIAELQDLVRCRCHDAYKGRGLHDPTCCCDYAEALKVVACRIEELEAKLAKAAKALIDLADCVDLGCFCSEMEQATVMDKARTTLAEMKGDKDE